MKAIASEISEAAASGSAPKPFSLIFLKRLGVFFFALCDIEIFYWYSGSFQSFLDATQIMLITLLYWSALGLLLTALLGLSFSVGLAVLRKYLLRVGGLLGYIFLGLFASGALMLADSLIILHRGLR